MFTKKLALVLCVGAVVLLVTAGANATITMTQITAASSYDLTGASDFFVADGAQNPAGDGSLSLATSYTSGRDWWGGTSYDQTVNNMTTGRSIGAGPAITTVNGTTTGYHVGQDNYGLGFSFDAGVAGRTLNFVWVQLDQYDYTTIISVTNNTAITTSTNAGYYVVTADLPTTGGTVFVSRNEGDNSDVFGGVEAAWVTSVPEPATMCLLVIGGIGALLKRRRNV